MLNEFFSVSKYRKIDAGWGLQHSPVPLAGFKGAASRQEGNGGEGRTREGEEGKGEWGRRGKGGSWGE